MTGGADLTQVQDKAGFVVKKQPIKKKFTPKNYYAALQAPQLFKRKKKTPKSRFGHSATVRAHFLHTYISKPTCSQPLPVFLLNKKYKDLT